MEENKTTQNEEIESSAKSTLNNIKDKVSELKDKATSDETKEKIKGAVDSVKDNLTKENLDKAVDTVKENLTKENLDKAVDTVKETFTKENLEKTANTVKESLTKENLENTVSNIKESLNEENREETIKNIKSNPKFKKIITIVAIFLLILFVLKGCGGSSMTEKTDTTNFGARFTFTADEFIEMYNELIKDVEKNTETDCSKLILPSISTWESSATENENGTYTTYMVSNGENAFIIEVDPDNKVIMINYTDPEFEHSDVMLGALLSVASGERSGNEFDKINKEITETEASHYIIDNACATIADDGTILVFAADKSLIEKFENPYFLK